MKSKTTLILILFLSSIAIHKTISAQSPTLSGDWNYKVEGKTIMVTLGKINNPSNHRTGKLKVKIKASTDPNNVRPSGIVLYEKDYNPLGPHEYWAVKRNKDIDDIFDDEEWHDLPSLKTGDYFVTLCLLEYSNDSYYIVDYQSMKKLSFTEICEVKGYSNGCLKDLKFPAISIHDIDGNNFTTSQVMNNGNPFIVITYMGCFGPKMLNKISAQYGNWKTQTNVKVITICADKENELQATRTSIRSFQWPFVNLWDPGCQNFNNILKFNFSSVPIIMICDGNGVIKWDRLGMVEPDLIYTELRNIISGVSASPTENKQAGNQGPLKITECSCSQQYKPEKKCENAVDGNVETEWIAGGFAPQWIKLTLNGSHSISKIIWFNNMSPEGQVSMDFSFYNEYGNLVSTKSESFYAKNGQTNSATFIDLNGIRQIKITVTKSPSWVSFKEIYIY